jgi:uncharacterized membrane protein YbhN (UPF0104 family)
MVAGSLLFTYLALSGSARSLSEENPQTFPLSLPRQPRSDYLLLALALVGLSHLLQSLVWHLYARDLHGERDALKDIFRYSITALTRNLPGAFYWSTASRALLYQKDGRTSFAAVATGVELSLQAISGGALALVLLAWPWGLLPALALLALPLLPGTASVWQGLAALGVVSAHWPALSAAFLDLARLSRRSVATAIAGYVIMWLIGGLFLEALVQAIGGHLPPRQALYGIWVATSLVGIAGAVLLGGLGVVRELSLAGLLAPLTTLPVATVLAILSRLVLILGSWLWGSLTAAICHFASRRRGEI